MAPRPFFAVRISIVTEDGCTHSRVYVRPPSSHFAKNTFETFALGETIRIVTESSQVIGASTADYAIRSWDITRVSEQWVKGYNESLVGGWI